MEKRPQETDRDILEAAARTKANELAESWASEPDALAEDLADAFENDLDQYKLAKFMESRGYTMNESYMDDLSDCWYRVNEWFKYKLKNWVISNDIKLTIPIGVKVTFIDYPSEREAEVVKHFPDSAQYGLWWEGHRSRKGEGCRLINCEDVKEITQ